MKSDPDNTLKTAIKSKTPKAIGSTQSLSSFVKGICDVKRRSNCASALQYVPELNCILFLRILDVDLKTRLPNLNASCKQRVIGRIMTAVEKVRVGTWAMRPPVRCWIRSNTIPFFGR